MTQALTYVFCLGATKAGTSWLHDQLATHTDCRLRTIKEYHYFNKSRLDDFARAIKANEREIARLKAKNATRPPELNLWSETHISDLQAYDAVLSKGARDDEAFAQMLAAGSSQGHVVGDFTPAYALLSQPELTKLAKYAPDTRAIYLIRDPVQRLWSHVRMVAERADPADLADAAWSLLRRVVAGEPSAEAKGITQRGDYAGIVPKLMRAFAPSRLLVMFYEEMLSAPGYARICRFLGIEERPADFSRKVHAGTPLGLSGADRAAATRFLRPQYEFAASLFPALPEAWQLAMNEA